MTPERLNRNQKDLHTWYTLTVDDIKFAKTQMWRLTFYAISLMLAMAFLKGSLGISIQCDYCDYKRAIWFTVLISLN